MCQNHPGAYIHKDKQTTRDYIYRLLEQPATFHVTICCPDLQKLADDFRSCFKNVKAAGGVVKNNGQILAIRRLGVYDLPKGHMENGETPAGCAVREVQEECGVKQLAVLRPMSDTWHIYLREDIWHLKQTYWFAMTCPAGQPLTPQTEEDIEEAFWINIGDIDNIRRRSYLSLRQIWEEAKSI